jgi:hypothetical protein
MWGPVRSGAQELVDLASVWCYTVIMRDLFDPRSFGPPRATTYRRHRPRVIDLFDIDSFGPQAGDRRLSAFRHHIAWIGQQEWPARIVIILGEITLVYLVLVFGMLFGAGFSAWL